MYNDRELTDLNKSLRAYDRLVFRIRILTSLTEVSLRYMGLRTTEKLLSYFSKNTPAPGMHDGIIILDKYAAIFNRMKLMNSYKGRCLSQSLVMRLLLKREGIPSELKIGVNRQNGHFDAHAWLEQDGKLINDHPSVIATYFVLPENKTNTILTFK